MREESRLKIPQHRYRGTTKMVLDISRRSALTYTHAKRELNRWGRVGSSSMFVAGLLLREVLSMAETKTMRLAVRFSSASLELSLL
jgi:hypothetical protein